MSTDPFTVAAAVLAVVQEHLGVRAPTRSLVTIAPVAADDCCAGQLAVSPLRAFRATTPFPTEVPADEACDGLTAVDLVVSYHHCVPVVLDNGQPPEVEAVEEAHASLLADAATIWAAVTSDELIEPGDWERANVSQTFTSEGGCVLVSTLVTLGVDGWCLDG